MARFPTPRAHGPGRRQRRGRQVGDAALPARGRGLNASIGAPFDAVAAGYDAAFSATRLGRWLRARVHAVADRWIAQGASVLEIGCGTGEDACWLAERGCRVMATDVSAAMLAAARAKAQRRGFDLIDPAHPPRWVSADRGGIALARVAADDLPRADIGGPFDVVLSNFGAINCVQDLPALGAWLETVVRPGGVALLVPMGPLCPWEVVLMLRAGRVRSAIRRWRRHGVVAPVGRGTLRVRYPTAGCIARALGTTFRLVHQESLGLLLPTTDGTGLVDRWPALFARLNRLEARIATWPLMRSIGDHRILVFQRLR